MQGLTIGLTIEHRHDMSTSQRYTAFFYGTLLHPSILRRVIGHHGAELEICPALLLEHTRHKVAHADYPGVVPYAKTRQLLGIADPSKDLQPEDRSVRGTLVRGLTENDVRLLDTFEGDEYARRVVSVHPLAPFATLADAAADLVPTAPPPLTPEFVEALPRTHPPVDAHTYIWIQPLSELTPELWDFAEFVRDNAWKWVGAGARDNEYYTEVDHRREMDGRIVERKIVNVEGAGDEMEKRVVVELEHNPWKDANLQA